MLASGINFTYLAVILAIAAIGKIKEWMDSQKKTNTPPPTMRPDRSPQPIAQAGSEEERMRRFLEALGMPGGNQSPPPLTPVASPLRRPVEVKKPRPQPQVIRPRAATPVPEPLPMESRDPGRLEEPAASIERISAEWDEMAKGVKLSAMETPQAPVQSQFSLPFASRDAASSAADIRSAMRTPATLRTAILLREILGPPPSLQS